MGSVLGLGLIYLGALNTLLALNAGTCTQGGADRLMGGVFSLALYGLGLFCLYLARSRNALWALIPMLPIALAQTWFAVRLTFGHLVQGISACNVLSQIPEMDGREGFYSALWLSLSFLFIVGVAACVLRAKPSFSPGD